MESNRRDFLKFLGVASILSLTNKTEAIDLIEIKTSLTLAQLTFLGINPNSNDDVILSEELTYQKLISWGDSISDKDSFGFNNDYLCFFPTVKNGTEGILWVNHEYCDRLYINGNILIKNITKEQIEKEMYSVGGSLLKIIQNQKTKKWEFVKNDPYNKRISALTPITFANNVIVKNSDVALGTLGNCAGGKTPWNTLLTCEENYDSFYGETVYENNIAKHIESELGWEKFYNQPPEHYGWVVEINPFTGEAKKQTSMGRFAHECATTIKTNDELCVVYTGDDANNECLYKFISDKPNSLDTGKLYVADIENGKWILLDVNTNENLKKEFKTQLDLLIQCRKASAIMGGTKLDRPEDIEIHPFTKEIFISLTNNIPSKNYYGKILKITEDNNDNTSLTFKYEYYKMGGEDSNFACPDNLAFDNIGNLWFTSDISGKYIGKDQYSKFKNNGLFVVPTKGINSGKVIQMASAPINAEFTGPCFSPDYKSLFLSVQHPGEYSYDIKNSKSNWPDGLNQIPRPTVIVINVK